MHSHDSEEERDTFSSGKKSLKNRLINIVLCEGGVAKDHLTNVDKLTALIHEVERTCFLTQAGQTTTENSIKDLKTHKR